MYGRFGELLLIVLLAFLFFGAGKLPKVMKDIGVGIKALRKGLDDNKESHHSSKRKRYRFHRNYKK